MINLDKCNWSFNIIDDFSTKIGTLNKTKIVNVKVFNMIAIIYESKALTKHFMWLLMQTEWYKMKFKWKLE